MTSTETGPGPADSVTLEVGGREVVVERVSARKASVAFAIIRGVGKKLDPVIHAWGKFQAEYESSHTIEVDRPTALLRYGPRPIIDELGRPLLYPDTITIESTVEGEPNRVEVHPRAGEVVMAPSPLESMDDDAWAAQGNVMKRPRSPSWGESATAVLPDVIEDIEDHVYKLLALFTMPNAEVKAKRKDGTIHEELDRLANDLMDDAYLDEVLELAVACGDVVDGAFRAKVEKIGGSRVGKALRLLGVDPTALQPKAQEPAQTSPEAPQTSHSEESQEPSSQGNGRATPPSSTPTSSGDTDDSDSDGRPTTSSTPHGTSSRPSDAEPITSGR